MNATINSINSNNENNFRKAGYALIWWSKTIFNAFMLPYYAVAAAFAFSFLIGLSFTDVRQTVVGFAGLEFNSWAELGMYWKIASLSISAVYVLYSVLNCNPVTTFLNKLFSPILNKVDLFLSTKKGLFIFAAFATTLFFSLLSHTTLQEKTTPNLILTKPYSPSSTASIVLPNGEIVSGNANVVKQYDSYIVSFKK